VTRRDADPSARARADGDFEELVAWCAVTPDVLAFREALRRVGPERWSSVHARVAEALMAGEPRGAAPSGNAADRARRSRSAARVLKLRMLDEELGTRSARHPAARALLGPARPAP
jgi:hypothetical protein